MARMRSTFDEGEWSCLGQGQNQKALQTKYWRLNFTYSCLGSGARWTHLDPLYERGGLRSTYHCIIQKRGLLFNKEQPNIQNIIWNLEDIRFSFGGVWDRFCLPLINWNILFLWLIPTACYIMKKRNLSNIWYWRAQSIGISGGVPLGNLGWMYSSTLMLSNGSQYSLAR